VFLAVHPMPTARRASGGGPPPQVPRVLGQPPGGFCLRAPPEDPASTPPSASTARTPVPTPASSSPARGAARQRDSVISSPAIPDPPTPAPAPAPAPVPVSSSRVTAVISRLIAALSSWSTARTGTASSSATSSPPGPTRGAQLHVGHPRPVGVLPGRRAHKHPTRPSVLPTAHEDRARPVVLRGVSRCCARLHRIYPHRRLRSCTRSHVSCGTPTAVRRLISPVAHADARSGARAV